MTVRSRGRVVGRTSCEHCGSQDNRAVYENDDGTITSWCYTPGCGNLEKHEVLPTLVVETKTPGAGGVEINGAELERIGKLPSISLQDRKIPKAVTLKYGVKSEVTESGKELARYYPVRKKGAITGYKRRILPKTFSQVGDARRPVDLFGQHLFKGGKRIIITEGEEDALAAYTMTALCSSANRGFPAVSVGSASDIVNAVRENLQYLEQFDQVIFAVDQEPEPLAKAEEAGKLLTPGKAMVLKFSEKDASDLLLAGKKDEFWGALWNTAEVEIGGIVEGAEQIFSTWLDRKNYECIEYPPEWGMDFCPGFYAPSLVTVTAGTGVGKSSVLKHMQYYLWERTRYGIGVISMEEPIGLCSGILAGMAIKKRITVPDHGASDEEIHAAYRKVFGDGRMVYCDNTGIRNPEDLYNVIRFMANSRECRFIFVDHLTALVNKLGSGGKNDYTEKLVNTLNDLCMELNVCIILVSHLRKTPNNSDKTYESGLIPTEDAIFGSSAIKQYSHQTIAISRDKTEDGGPMFLHVLKDRLSGQTGKSVPLFYNMTTGWYETSPGVRKDTQEDTEQDIL